MPPGSFSGGLYALALFGLFAAVIAAIGVCETPAAVRPRPLEAAVGD